MKRLRLSCILIWIVFLLSGCGKERPASSSEQRLINPDGIASVRFSGSSDGAPCTAAQEDIGAIVDILNTARYDDERNDGRMFKMEAPSLTITIRYDGGEEVTVQLWDQLMYVDRTWYQLDRSNADALSELLNQYADRE